MKGDIYTRQKCPICGARMIHNEKRNGCFCKTHPRCAADRYFVRFETVFKNFNEYQQASQFLAGLRFKAYEGSFDPRDYQKDAPLGFATLAEKYVSMKRQQGLKSLENIACYMRVASEYFGQKNIKTFTRSDIREFLYSIKSISEKTRHNYMSCLRDFFRNMAEDEIITTHQIPAMPPVPFELGFRAITDIETQTAVLEKIKAMTWEINPKIWLGCDMLALYVNIRPQDLLNIKEGDIDADHGVIIIRRPTKRRGKINILSIRLIDEHKSEIARLQKKYPAVPTANFFRHESGRSGTHPSAPFGGKYLYKWAKRACNALGISGLDLYGLTRHTTVTALAHEVGQSGAKLASGHNTNKAFDRYCQYQDDGAFDMVRVAAKMKGKIIEFKKRKHK